MNNVKNLLLFATVLLSVSSCATIQLDPANRAEQVSLIFDKTIK